MTRFLVPLVSVLALSVLASCSSDSDADSDAESGGGSDGAGFRDRAAVLCTETVNEHLLTEESAAGIEVLQAIMKDEEPTAEQYAAWSEEIGGEVERREAIRESLGGISPDEAEDKEHWEAIVAAGDQELELTTTRRDLLEGRDWEEISSGWSRNDDGRGLPEDALVALELERTDCQSPYSPAVVTEGTEDFVRAAATTCTEIVNRRHAADSDADADAVLDVLVQIHEDGEPGDIPDATAEALSRLETEWERTTEDFRSVDGASASDPEAWEQTIAAAEERTEIFGDRVEAVESGDDKAILAAFDLARYAQPGAGFDRVGLAERSCAGIRF